MNHIKKMNCRRRRGVVLIISMIFILIFSAFAVSMATLSGTNVQLADNQHKINTALCAAQSGLECGKYIIANYEPVVCTDDDAVTLTQANQTWSALSTQAQQIWGQTFTAARFTDSAGSGDEIITSAVNFGTTNASFRVRFYRYDANPYTIKLESIGTNGQVTKQVVVDMDIVKDTEILTYAVASRGGMILWSGSEIQKDPNTGEGGHLYSFWDQYTVSDTSGSRDCEPYKISGDSIIEGEIKTHESYERWTDPTQQSLTEEIVNYDTRIALDANDPLRLRVDFDEPVVESFDTDDFDTSAYKDGSWSADGQPLVELVNYARNYGDNAADPWPDVNVPAENRRSAQIEVGGQTVTVLEGYWNDPEQPGELSSNGMQFPPNHTSPREYFDRPIFINRNFDNIKIPKGTNPLFINCTFSSITYVDVSEDGNLKRPKMSKWNQSNADWNNAHPDSTPKNTWSGGQNSDAWNDDETNNVMFQGCDFTGPVITAVPNDYWWTKNSLNFAGGCDFYNDFLEESTILAPNFNVNIGSFTKGETGTPSVLNGIIVGGTVDIRGEVTVDGTVLSMWKPTRDIGKYRTSYYTNIGHYGDAESGGCEDDTGTTIIRSNSSRQLPLGVVSDIILDPNQETYTER